MHIDLFILSISFSCSRSTTQTPNLTLSYWDDFRAVTVTTACHSYQMTARYHVTPDFLATQAWALWARTMIRLSPTPTRIFTETNSLAMVSTYPTGIERQRPYTAPHRTLNWRLSSQMIGQTRGLGTTPRIHRTLRKAIQTSTALWNRTVARPWTGSSSARRNCSRERFWRQWVLMGHWFVPSLPSLLFEWTMMDWTQV